MFITVLHVDVFFNCLYVFCVFQYPFSLDSHLELEFLTLILCQTPSQFIPYVAEGY